MCAKFNLLCKLLIFPVVTNPFIVPFNFLFLLFPITHKVVLPHLSLQLASATSYRLKHLKTLGKVITLLFSHLHTYLQKGLSAQHILKYWGK